PGLGGSVYKLDGQEGKVLNRVDPFSSGGGCGGSPELDVNAYVSSPLVADSAGAIYYHVIRLQAVGSSIDALGYLVKVSTSDQAPAVPVASLALGAPASNARCTGVFGDAVPRPLPPPPDETGTPARPPSGPCFSQRPPVNVAPAIGSDGSVYTVSRAHRN